MLGLVVFLKAVVRREDFRWDDEIVGGWKKGPEIGTQHHDGEGDVHVVMVLCHSLLEGVCDIFAEAHICVWQNINI